MTARILGRSLSPLLALGTMLSLGVGCGGSSQGAAPGGDPQADLEETVSGEVLVGVSASSLGDPALESRLASVGTVLLRSAANSYYRVKLFDTVTVDEAQAELAGAGVTYVEPNYVVHAAAADPLYADPTKQPSAFSSAFKGELDLAWTVWGTGVAGGATTVNVCVLDTGIRTTHEEFANTLSGTLAHNFVLGTDNAVVDDDNGHGTAVSGILAAEYSNGKGMAGIAGISDGQGTPHYAASIVPVKVLGADGKGNHADVAEGITWAGANGCKVILVAFDSGSPSYTLQAAVQSAYAAGALVIAAAGNTYSSQYRYPAAYQSGTQDVVAVGYVDETDALVAGASGSNFGAWVSIVAPGDGLWTTLMSADNAYTTNLATSVSGSSFAAAEVAGAAALIWSEFPALTRAQVKNLLLSTTDSYGRAPGKSIATGGGRLNVLDALAYAAAPAATAASSLTFDALSVASNGTVNATITMLNPAAGPTTYTFHQTAANVLKLPASVVVPAGAKTYSFKVTASSVNALTNDMVGLVEAPETAETIVVGPPQVTQLTFSPNAVVGGATATGTVTLSTAAPAGGLGVTIACAGTDAAECGNLNINGGSGTVTVPQGATSKTFTVVTAAVTAVKNVKITGAAPGQGAAVPAVDNLAIKPLVGAVTFAGTTVRGGGSITGTVKLCGPAPSAISVTLNVTAGGAAVTVPASVTFTAGSTTKTFTVTANTVAANTAVSVTASYSGATTSAGSFTVTAPVLSTVSSSASSIIWWDATHSTTSTVTVTLDSAVAGATTVYLSANSDVASLPATVSIGAGNSTTFTVSPVATLTAIPVTISVSLAANMSNAKTVTVTVKPALASMTLSAQSVAGGSPVTGTVKLNGAAPAGGFSVNLSSDNGRATVGASVSVGAGLTSNTFTVTTTAGATTVTANIAADVNGVSSSVALKVTEPTISTFTLSTTTAMAGVPVTGTVTLTGGAPAGYTVALTSSNQGIVADGSLTVTFNPGDVTKTFTFTPHNVATTTSLTVKAVANGSTKTASVSVMPTISSLTLASSALVVPGTTTLTIRLSAAAPTGNLVMSVASSDVTKATVSAGTATVLFGAQTATVTVTAQGAGTANIQVTYDGQTKSVPVTVAAGAVVTSLTLDTPAPSGGVVTAMGPIVGTVTLDRVPTVNTPVTITTSDAAKLPGTTVTVTVAAGLDHVAFTLTPASDAAGVGITVRGAVGAQTPVPAAATVTLVKTVFAAPSPLAPGANVAAATITTGVALHAGDRVALGCYGGTCSAFTITVNAPAPGSSTTTYGGAWAYVAAGGETTVSLNIQNNNVTGADQTATVRPQYVPVAGSPAQAGASTTLTMTHP